MREECTEEELAGECEKMMCKDPFVRTPVGVKKLNLILSDSARLAATPFGCGQCLHCRINRARVWTHRILLEQLCHGDNCFITLTYNDECVPRDKEVKKRELQLYIKRLRKRVGKKIRYFAVGEYGDVTYRPHYHAVIFGLSMMMRKEIEDSWKDNGKSKGYVGIGDLNEKSARYITGYVVKKVKEHKDKRLMDIKQKEFMLCSTRPGIGVEAVRKMAEIIKKSDHFDLDSKAIKELRYGKKTNMPLGGHLTKKLSEALGQNKGLKDLEFYDKQEEIFEMALNGGVYYDEIDKIDKEKRKSQEKKEKIFRRSREL